MSTYYHEFHPEQKGSEYCKCGLHRLDSDHIEARAKERPEAAMPETDAVKELHARIIDLLNKTCSFAQCKGCVQGIYWTTARTAAYRKIAFNPDGTNHFTTCTSQAEFSKPQPVQGVLGGGQ